MPADSWSRLCGAATVVPVLGVTVICELEPHGLDVQHHGYIGPIPGARSQHESPQAYDWTDEPPGDPRHVGRVDGG